jgi:hypothetical protein
LVKRTLLAGGPSAGHGPGSSHGSYSQATVGVGVVGPFGFAEPTRAIAAAMSSFSCMNAACAGVRTESSSSPSGWPTPGTPAPVTPGPAARATPGSNIAAAVTATNPTVPCLLFRCISRPPRRVAGGGGDTVIFGAGALRPITGVAPGAHLGLIWRWPCSGLRRGAGPAEC